MKVILYLSGMGFYRFAGVSNIIKTGAYFSLRSHNPRQRETLMLSAFGTD